MKGFLFKIITIVAVLSSCKTFYQPKSVAYKDYRITAASKTDSLLISMLKPFSDSVNKSMNDIIIFSEKELTKRQPEGTLGNMMADAMLAEAITHFKQQVDAAFINYGGIRLNSLAAGSITRGKIFELSPFDNIIVLLKLKGSILQQLANHISSRGGWPAAGISWQMKDKQAINVAVNNIPIIENKDYTIALVDYVANGGDDCEMLKAIQQQNDGFIYRDALLHYLSQINKAGKKISYSIENRITNAK